MDLRLEAASWFLIGTNEATVEQQLTALEGWYDANDSASNVETEDGETITIWAPFEYDPVCGLLERISDLEEVYNEIFKAGVEQGKATT